MNSRAMKMKVWMIFLLAVTMFTLIAKDRVYVRLGYNAKMVTGDMYKHVYGSKVMGPELRLGVRIVGPVGLWCGYGQATVSGHTIEMKADTRFHENIFMAGATVQARVKKALVLFAEGGYGALRYTEDAFADSIKGDVSGWVADAGIVIRMGKWVGAVLSGGFSSFWDKGNPHQPDFSGYRFGASLEARF